MIIYNLHFIQKGAHIKAVIVHVLFYRSNKQLGTVNNKIDPVFKVNNNLDELSVELSSFKTDSCLKMSLKVLNNSYQNIALFIAIQLTNYVMTIL